jgi:glucuronosyltransferase
MNRIQSTEDVTYTFTVLYITENNNFALLLLAHPNVRLFITHGGLLSMQETIMRGVPIIGIPILGDQKLNMAKAVSAGYAIQLKYADITAESLIAAIKEVLSNPR